MKMSECGSGDIVNTGTRTMKFITFKRYDVTQYWFKIIKSNYINEFEGMIIIFNHDDDVNLIKSKKEMLEETIHEKELELSELKKEYFEHTVSKKLKEKTCYKINDKLVYIDSIHAFYFNYFKIPQESKFPYTLSFSSVISIEEVPELTISYNKFLDDYNKVVG